MGNTSTIEEIVLKNYNLSKMEKTLEESSDDLSISCYLIDEIIKKKLNKSDVKLRNKGLIILRDVFNN